MIKKINVFLVLLLILISISAVSAVDDANMTETVSSEANQDTLDASIDDADEYASSGFEDTISVDDSSSELSAGKYTITSSNYNQYFDSKTGESSKFKSGDTVQLSGTFSKTKFVFNKTVNIVGVSKNNMKESTITLLSGASGSTISQLNIVNTKNETYGIFLNSASDCTVQNCVIKNTGRASYCICLANNANYNTVSSNTLTTYGVTYGHNQRSTPPLVLSGSHHNTIKDNTIGVDDANAIYLSSYAGGPLMGGESNYNIISKNTIKYNVLPTSWSWGIQVMGSNNKIHSNTITGAYRGISTAGYSNNITSNTINKITGADYNNPKVEVGGEYGIVASYNSYVANNKIIGAKIISTGAGISAADNSIVEKNNVEVTSKGRGIVASGYNIIVRNNVITTDSGSGVYQNGDVSDLVVKSNNITSSSGVGVLVEKLSSKRMPKDVTISGNTIKTGNKYAIDVSGVQKGTAEISSNKIVGSSLINSPNGIYDASRPTYVYKGTTHKITPKNIRTYINDNGGLTSEIKDGDILSFEGIFRNEVIYVTKGVKITGNSPKFYNSTFKVTSGNVLIENLIIVNNKADRVNAWGIYVNQASGVKIMNNKISVCDSKAAYAIYVLESSYIDVVDNTLTSEGDYLTFTLLAYSCEDCNFTDNTINTKGTGDVYNFKTERCIDGNEVVIDGVRYCLDGNELFIDGKRYCLDGNEICIDGITYCVDGNEICIDGKTYCLDCNEVIIDGKSVCIDGNEVFIDGNKFCLDGNEVCIDGVTYCIDGNEVCVDGVTYCLDGNEVITNDGKSICIDGNEVCIDGVTYCIDGNEVCVDGVTYCFDGNEVCVDGKETYCFDGNENQVSGAHVVSEIYQTYGILLLYSSNNIIDKNTVNVTSKLSKQYPTTGNGASTNSIVGIDLYFNTHNNTISNNNVIVSGKDNYIYGMGVLGYYTGHSASKGQGATNNVFAHNKVTVSGPYCVEGIIVGDESQDTLIESNVVKIKNGAAVYGIYFELSHKSTAKNNNLTLSSKEVIYGIQGYNSNSNIISNNIVKANAKEVFGVILSNGNDNAITDNTINANGNGETVTTRILDTIASGNAGIYLKANSTNNLVENNKVTSAKRFAVLLDSEAINNIIVNNYLDSEKGIGNKAVYISKNNNVTGNYKYIAKPKTSEVNVQYLESADIKLTFDSSIDGAYISFYDVDGAYIGKSKVTKGIASVKYKFDNTYAPGDYSFSAVLSKTNYKSSNYDIRVVVDKGDLVIDVSKPSIQQGSTGKITATVLDKFGNQVKGLKVDFYRKTSARYMSIGSAVTNANGVATLNYEVPLSLDDGSYVILVKVSGNKNYNDANKTSTLKVTKKPLLSGGKDYSVYYGSTVKYKVRALTKYGKAVSGKYVTFYIDGQKVKNVKTDKNGYASYSVKLKTGTHTIKASFNGYSKSNKITFKPTLIAKNLSKKKAKTTKFTVKLVNKNGKILKGKKVTFKFKGKKYTAKTSKKGIATLSLKNLKVGKYSVTASYGGCTIKKTIKITK
ncbi:right-handed parallel beta-helix repeat-containing protein [Methanobrevibacter sp.]|uniref:right-handed parallel beta-helix repeat-containing protein n=1 Tax=Methanobrevibacter sp. TaxID=66852 RepID=UPI0038697625